MAILPPFALHLQPVDFAIDLIPLASYWKPFDACCNLSMVSMAFCSPITARCGTTRCNAERNDRRCDVSAIRMRADEGTYEEKRKPEADTY